MDILDRLVSGELSYPRFTPAEIKASYGTSHDQIWHYILSLESAKLHARRGGGGSPRTDDPTQPNRARNWDDSQLGTRVGWDPRQGPRGNPELKLKEIKYFDKGVESIVYRTEDNKVRKFRQIHPYSANGVIDELAKIVYHNYLFPKDAYVLNDILRYEEDGYRFFFLDINAPGEPHAVSKFGKRKKYSGLLLLSMADIVFSIGSNTSNQMRNPVTPAVRKCCESTPLLRLV